MAQSRRAPASVIDFLQRSPFQFPIPHSHFYGGGKTPLSRPKNGGCVIEVARVVFKGGKPSDVEDFVAGWMKDGRVLGRPAVLITGADGALYVSDDNKGFMYRVSFGEI
jgi:hypothetical protein